MSNNTPSNDTPSDDSTPATTPVAAPAPLPLSIKLALFALLLFLISSVIVGMPMVRGGSASFLQITIRLVIASAVLYGTIARHRMAWQWGRILAMVAAVFTSVPVIAVVIKGPGLDPKEWILHIWLFVQVAALLAVFFAFERRSAKRHFGLVCPKCGAATRQPADRLFSQARCSDCGKVW